MKTKRTVKCNICGAIINAQGIGGHKELKHGIVERVVLIDNTSSTRVERELNTSSTRVEHELNTSSTRVEHELPTRVKRPCDYLKKKENVVKTVDIPVCIGGKYEYNDVITLLNKIFDEIISPINTGDFLAFLRANEHCEIYIKQFELKFECKFDRNVIDWILNKTENKEHKRTIEDIYRSYNSSTFKVSTGLGISL